MLCGAVAAIAGTKDGKDLLHGDPYRSYVVLKKTDLRQGDVLTVLADYFDVIDRF